MYFHLRFYRYSTHLCTAQVAPLQPHWCVHRFRLRSSFLCLQFSRYHILPFRFIMLSGFEGWHHITGVRIRFSRHSPNWWVVQYFYSPSQKTSGQKYRKGQWEGKNPSPDWQVGLYFYSPVLNSTRIGELASGYPHPCILDSCVCVRACRFTWWVKAHLVFTCTKELSIIQSLLVLSFSRSTKHCFC
jgi:hypothetical protein